MKAIILAGWYGTRLYPLTINAPKPMIQVGGKPMVDYLREKIQAHPQIDHTYIVTNHKFAHVFTDWLQTKNTSGITIVDDGTMANEDRLGSVGDMQFVIEKYNITDDVIILGGDNIFEDDLSGILADFKEKWNVISLYDNGDIEQVKQFNNLITDEQGKIQEFVEKPEHPTSTLHAALTYVLKNETLKHIPSVIKAGKADRAGDLIAYICQHEDIYTYTLKGKWFDIGTLEQLGKAEEWITAWSK